MVELKEANVLLVEDNVEFAKNTTKTLEIYFKKVYHALNVSEALKLFKNCRLDVMIVDVRLENENGLDFIQMIREVDGNVPIVVLSAHKDVDFLFQAIPLNLLSYEIKPLSYKNLTSLLQKISEKLNPEESVALGENLKYLYGKKELAQLGATIPLTKKESLFIELLIKNSNGVLTNEVLQRDVWKEDTMSAAAIKNLIFRLRQKVSEDFITTISNVGYRLFRRLYE
ncbi:MAG: hypothetical protein DRI37_09910 [Chloroflexi bacterium]|nr:MAG: hypothetical protein DRI37_09910 [Chloroflexota bacterium]